MTINVGFLICSPIIQHILPIINLLSKNEGYNVFNDNLSLHNFKKYDFFYSRFSMHALHITDIVTLIKNLKLSYNKNSLLFIETRSIKGTSNENLDYCITNFKSPIGESHTRTLLNINY